MSYIDKYKYNYLKQFFIKNQTNIPKDIDLGFEKQSDLPKFIFYHIRLIDKMIKTLPEKLVLRNAQYRASKGHLVRYHDLLIDGKII